MQIFENPMNLHIIRLALIMLTCGIGGGIINYYLNHTIQIDDSIGKRIIKNPYEDTLFKCIIIGVGASFLVPLLLKMISSNLLESSGKDAIDYFIISGFCLTASISSRAFISSISEKILKLTKETKEEVEIAKKDLKNAENKIEAIETNLEEQDLPLVKDEEYTQLKDREDLTEDEYKVLNSFNNSRFIYRTITNVAKELAMPLDGIQIIFESLLKKHFIFRVMRSSGEKFQITFAGRLAIINYEQNETN
ncbi:MAG TPA: hypothetical protein PKE39_14550 [Ignavibacteria bacterium]|nr:hypothetical protein [Ignavibacteria bacterium]HMR00239.1 hypothetical protein [Ignavibacteria bacterium]